LSEFPLLALIAQDVLACSGTSATVEQTFSAAADVCSSGRKSLTSATIERCVSSHMWLQQGFKAGGIFTDCQVVVDEAEKKAKFATQVAKRSEPINITKSSMLPQRPRSNVVFLLSFFLYFIQFFLEKSIYQPIR
jgi:hypothetical protein